MRVLLGDAAVRRPPRVSDTVAGHWTLPASSRGRSAELLVDERGDPSTEGFGLFLRRSLGEDSHDRLRAGGTDEHTPVPVQLAVDGLQTLHEGLWEGAAADPRQI